MAKNQFVILNEVKNLYQTSSRFFSRLHSFRMTGLLFIILSGLVLVNVKAIATPSAANYPAPEISGIATWINSKPLTIKEQKGKVVLVDFWAYSCINCLRTLSHLSKWDSEYRDKGLVIIGVHAPEFEFEKNQENVEKAAQKYGIKYPVAMDNDMKTWGNFNNRYWPAHYLIDKQGNVVYTHFGEGNYEETENKIKELLGDDGKAKTQNDRVPVSFNQTPETYLGYGRAENFVSDSKFATDAENNFAFPKELAKNQWALSGKWKIENEKIIAQEKGAKLRLNFTASKVFLVLGSASGKAVNMKVKVDGKDTNKLTIDSHRLYELLNQNENKNSLLEIEADSAGLEAYAFTFESKI